MIRTEDSGTSLFVPAEDDIFAIIVHGIVPEFMPHRAFRRDKQAKHRKTKDIKCPYCHGLLKIVEATVKLELLRYSRKDKSKVAVDKSMPCNKCHSIVGIIYLAA